MIISRKNEGGPEHHNETGPFLLDKIADGGILELENSKVLKVLTKLLIGDII